VRDDPANLRPVRRGGRRSSVGPRYARGAAPRRATPEADPVRWVYEGGKGKEARGRAAVGSGGGRRGSLWGSLPASAALSGRTTRRRTPNTTILPTNLRLAAVQQSPIRRTYPPTTMRASHAAGLVGVDCRSITVAPRGVRSYRLLTIRAASCGCRRCRPPRVTACSRLVCPPPGPVSAHSRSTNVPPVWSNECH
jgi:hypothetical protein